MHCKIHTFLFPLYFENVTKLLKERAGAERA